MQNVYNNIASYGGDCWACISISQHACFSYNQMHNSKIVPINIEDRIHKPAYFDVCHLQDS